MVRLSKLSHPRPFCVLANVTEKYLEPFCSPQAHSLQLFHSWLGAWSQRWESPFWLGFRASLSQLEVSQCGLCAAYNSVLQSQWQGHEAESRREGHFPPGGWSRQYERKGRAPCPPSHWVWAGEEGGLLFSWLPANTPRIWTPPDAPSSSLTRGLESNSPLQVILTQCHGGRERGVIRPYPQMALVSTVPWGRPESDCRTGQSRRWGCELGFRKQALMGCSACRLTQL